MFGDLFGNQVCVLCARSGEGLARIVWFFLFWVLAHSPSSRASRPLAQRAFKPILPKELEETNVPTLFVTRQLAHRHLGSTAHRQSQRALSVAPARPHTQQQAAMQRAASSGQRAASRSGLGLRAAQQQARPLLLPRLQSRRAPR